METQLSVEEYDALVDAGKIVAWTGDEARELSKDVRLARSRSGGPLTMRTLDSSGELREACRKIMQYQLRTPPSREPRQAGVRSAGSTWSA